MHSAERASLLIDTSDNEKRKVKISLTFGERMRRTESDTYSYKSQTKIKKI